MSEKITKERAELIIKTILEKKAEDKSNKAYIDSAKETLDKFLEQEGITEYSCKYGTVKVSDSVREGLEKEKVEDSVTKINNKEIDHIDMKDLYKETNVHIISIKAAKEGEE